MVSDLFFYQLGLIALVWLCCMLHWVWPSDRLTVPSPPLAQPTSPLLKRDREPKPFAGLITKPHCDVCAHVSALRNFCLPHAFFHVWTLREVLRFRVPPWPQPVGV